MSDIHISNNFLSYKKQLINISSFSKLSSENLSSLTNFAEINATKSYVPIAGCVLEHIVGCKDLTCLEKLFYIHADALSIITANKGEKRAVALPAEQWAKRLNCSKSQIFSLQKSLEEKGYFQIIKDKNKYGQNNRNIIFPSLPGHVYQALDSSSPNISNIKGAESFSHCVTYRARLDKVKLFIKLNYQLLKAITSNCDLSPLQKVIWLDFYSKCYKCHKKKENQELFSFTASYNELSVRYSSSISTISKSINCLENKDFLKKDHFFSKKDQSFNSRHDNSLWNFTLTAPIYLQQELVNAPNRTINVNEDEIEVEIETEMNNEKGLKISFGSANNVLNQKQNSSFVADNKSNISNIRPVRKLATSREFEGDTERRTAAYSNVREDSSTVSTYKLPLEVEFPNRSIDIIDKNSTNTISSTDPDLAKSGLLLNKENKIKYIKDKDIKIEGGNLTFNENIFLSESYKNSFFNKNSLNSSLNAVPELEIKIVSTHEDNLNKIINFNPIQNYTFRKPSIRPLRKLSSSQEFEGALERRTAAYLNVREDSSTTATYKLPEEVEFPKRSIDESNNKLPLEAELLKDSNKSLSISSFTETQKIDTKKLKDYHPLSQQEVCALNRKAGRSFSTNFTNQLLKKLIYKYPNKTFKNINYFYAYMIKTLRYEKHSEILVNHESFRFVSSESEKELMMKERYLAEIESYIDTTASTHLRKKIAARFETNLAYFLVKECQFEIEQQYEVEEGDNISLQEEKEEAQKPKTLFEVMVVKLGEKVVLTNHQKKLLEDEIQAVYADRSRSNYKNSQGNINVVFKQKKNRVWVDYSTKEQKQEQDYSQLWQNIREKLKSYFGEEWKENDNSWFSKLEAEVSKESGNVVLKAPNNFYKNWIKDKFLKYLEESCQALNLTLDRYDPIVVDE